MYAPQQVFRGDAIELGQRQQIGCAGVGGAGLPLGHRLAADAQGFRYELLGHLTAEPFFFQGFPQGFGQLGFLLPHLAGAQVFAQDNTTAEFTYTGSNDSDYKGQSTVVIEGKANSGNTEELQCVTVDMRKLAQFKNAKVLKFAKGVKYVAFKTKPDTGDKLDDKITGQDYLKSADKTGIEKIEFSSDFVKPYSHDWGNCIEEKLNQCFPKLKKVSISKNNKY